MCVAFVPEHPAGRTALVSTSACWCGQPGLLRCCVPKGAQQLLKPGTYLGPCGQQHPGMGSKARAALLLLFLPFVEMPTLFAKALPVVLGQSFAASGSASKSPPSWLLVQVMCAWPQGFLCCCRAGDQVCFLSAFWAAETLHFILQVLFFECTFQLFRNAKRQLLAAV